MGSDGSAVPPVRLAVIGAGIMGQSHLRAIAAAEGAVAVAVVDPDPAIEVAELPRFAVIAELVAAGLADGAVLATPNQLHEEGALALIAAGLPVLVEKPLATERASAARIVAAAEAAGTVLAVGHHRRHNPLVARAKALIGEGRLGRLVAVHATTWLMKPEAYFAPDWRRQPGGGPVHQNLIHDIDILRHLCGEVVEVSAMEASAARGHEVEDTAAALLRFESGAIGTMTLSDTAAAPWSWEQTAGENPAYPETSEGCYQIAGTHGSLSLPDLTLWSHPGERSWMAPISGTRLPGGRADPLIRQIEQFARAIRGLEPPLVSGRDGLAAIAIMEAIKRSVADGRPIRLTP